MSGYAKTKDVKITMPMGIYDEMIEILKAEEKWAYPQNFILEAVTEKIERLKDESGQRSVRRLRRDDTSSKTP